MYNYKTLHTLETAQKMGGYAAQRNHEAGRHTLRYRLTKEEPRPTKEIRKMTAKNFLVACPEDKEKKSV